MLTLKALKDYGADVNEGMSRCMNNEAFYLRLVGMLRSDTHLKQLEDALSKNDLKAGFEAAHALKGVLANLAIKPVLIPVNQMTELLRSGEQADYQSMLAEAKEQMNRLLDLMQD